MEAGADAPEFRELAVPQGRKLAFGSAQQPLRLRFLTVAVAHQVEHRIVAPEVAGSRPVSHPTYLLVVTCSLLVIQAVSVGADACLIGVRLAGYRLVGVVRQCSEERKKKGQPMPLQGVFRAWVLWPSLATRNTPVVLNWTYDVA